MSDHETLSAVLDNRQTPHQPFVVITDSAVFSGLPVFKEALKRALLRGGPVLLVTALHPVESLIPPGHVVGGSTKVIDITEAVPRYSDATAKQGIKRFMEAYSALSSGGQVFIDDLDILADNLGSYQAIHLIRSLLGAIKASKAPSRLITLLPHTSPFLPHILPPTLSATITHLHAHSPALLTHLSKSYLTPISAQPQFWQILLNAVHRRTAESLSFNSEEGLEVVGSSWREGMISVLVRKATGGAKGMGRSLGGMINGDVVGVEEVVLVNPISNPFTLGSVGAGGGHGGLDLSFNLSITDEQRRRRGEVPLPYAHEGEGPSGEAVLEFDEEEDEDDEEI